MTTDSSTSTDANNTTKQVTTYAIIVFTMLAIFPLDNLVVRKNFGRRVDASVVRVLRFWTRLREMLFHGLPLPVGLGGFTVWKRHIYSPFFGFYPHRNLF